jgi:DNA-binding CsgD family transcriptional regulator
MYLNDTSKPTMSSSLDHAFSSNDRSGRLLGNHPSAHPSAHHSAPSARPELEHWHLACLFDEMSLGMLLVSPAGQVLHCNRAALDAMASSGLLQVKGGYLQALSPADHQALQAALSHAAQGKRSLLALKAASISLQLSVAPSGGASALEGRGITLFFQRPSICDASVFLMFARNFSLTPTEQQVLTFLCRGLSTPEIADELNVAVSTVRSHVRSLCHKTASQGSRELISRIAMLPPAGYLPDLQMH